MISKKERKIMPRENCQKIKMLKLFEMLQQEADEDHPLTTSEIIKKLRAMGINCDRRTVATDMDTLLEFDYEIGMKMVSHEKGYYTPVKSFSTAELKIMMDAVQASNFISQSQTKELIDKIARLGGKRRKELLEENVVHFNTAKHNNEEVFENVASLEKALLEKKQVSFYYFDRDERRKKVYRNGKARYVADPIALIFHEDFYYLMSYTTKYDDITNFRVDRMESVVVEEEPVHDKALLDDTEIATYTEQVFKMYGGPIQDITIEFPRSLIGVVQDKFGEDANIVSIADDRCVASIQVQISPTFWGWLFQFAGEMDVISPKEISQEYKERAISVVKR